MFDHQPANFRFRAGDAVGILCPIRPDTIVDLTIASSMIVLIHALVVYSGLGAIIAGWAIRNNLWHIELVSLVLVLVILAVAWYGTFRCHAAYDEMRRRQTHDRGLRGAIEGAELSVSEYLADVSHGLRTPLSGIIGFSDLIRNECFGPLGDPRYAEYVEYIRENSMHMLAIVDGLLDLSRLDAGAGPRDESPSHVGTAIRAALRAVAPRAHEANIHVILQCDDDLPRLRVGERDLKTILISLACNAVAYNRDGGTVTIGARVNRTGKFIISVVDTGVGMIGKDIKAALSRYGRIENTAIAACQGAGLGLPLTKALVECYGGRLELQSDPGVGTIATVHFPAGRVERTRPDAAADAKDAAAA